MSLSSCPCMPRVRHTTCLPLMSTTLLSWPSTYPCMHMGASGLCPAACKLPH